MRRELRWTSCQSCSATTDRLQALRVSERSKVWTSQAPKRVIKWWCVQPLGPCALPPRVTVNIGEGRFLYNQPQAQRCSRAVLRSPCSFATWALPPPPSLREILCTGVSHRLLCNLDTICWNNTLCSSESSTATEGSGRVATLSWGPFRLWKCDGLEQTADESGRRNKSCDRKDPSCCVRHCSSSLDGPAVPLLAFNSRHWTPYVSRAHLFYRVRCFSPTALEGRTRRPHWLRWSVPGRYHASQ